MYLFDIEASPASPELTEALGRGLQYGGGGACNVRPNALALSIISKIALKK